MNETGEGALFATFSVDSAECQRRLKFVEVSERERQALSSVYEYMKEQIEGVVDDFSSRLLKNPKLRSHFDEETTLAHLKSSQRDSLLALFSGEYDGYYFSNRLGVGVIYEEVGLAPHWYMGSTAVVYDLLTKCLFKKLWWRPFRYFVVSRALAKLMSLDQQMVMDTYLGSSVGKLEALLHEVENATSVLASASAEISNVVDQQERTASDQASAVSQTTSTMSQLSVATLHSASQAEAAAVGARNGLQLAEEGTATVTKALEMMSNLRAGVEEIASHILHLSEQIGKISELTRFIGQLSNQTNLLALNAAVEAARAGDHGKGFAVVATEIRKLADQSKKSLEEINAIVTQVNKATDSTVMTTEEGTKTVANSVFFVEQTGTAFTALARSMNEIYNNAQSLSLNAKQQADASGQVGEAMSSINSGAKETEAGVRQTKKGVAAINTLAQDLMALTERHGRREDFYD